MRDARSYDLFDDILPRRDVHVLFIRPDGAWLRGIDDVPPSTFTSDSGEGLSVGGVVAAGC